MLIIFAFLHEDTIIGECVATINCTLGNVSVSASTIFHCHFGCKLKSISSASYIVLHLNVLIHPYTYTHFSLNEDTFNSTRDTQKAINPRPQWLCPPMLYIFLHKLNLLKRWQEIFNLILLFQFPYLLKSLLFLIHLFLFHPLKYPILI